jgi:hypothetical protein
MKQRMVILAVGLLAVSHAALAMNSAEIKLTSGPNYISYRAGAGVDLDPNEDWNVDLSFSQVQYTVPDASGWDNLVFLELNYFAAESLSFSGNYSHSFDSNNVCASGPGVSLFYTLFSPGDRDTPAGETPGQILTEAPPPADLFTAGLDGALLFYQADAPSASGLPSSSAVADGKIRLTQFLPSAFLDVALIPGRLNISASGSYSFYSDDPAQIAALSNISMTSTELAVLDSLMAGLLWTSWNTGTSLTLPYSLRFSGNYGRQKQVYPEEWVDNYDLSLSGKIFRSLKAKITWRHFTSTLGSSDLFTASLRLLF